MFYTRKRINRLHEHVYAVKEGIVLAGFCHRDPWWEPCSCFLRTPGCAIEPDGTLKRLTAKSPQFIRIGLHWNAATFSASLRDTIADAVKPTLKRMLTSFVLAGSLLSGTAYATDAGIIAAALPNEAAECRYLAQRREKYSYLLKEMERLTAYNKAQRLAGNNNTLTREQVIERIAELRVSGNLAVNAFLEFTEVVTVVRAKHEQMPTCFEAFSDIINLEVMRQQ